MGKVHPKDREGRKTKQKRRQRSANNRYLRPGALAQLRYNKVCAAKSSTDVVKQAVDVIDADKPKDDVVDNKFIEESPTVLSPVRFGFGPPFDNKSPTFLSPVPNEVGSFYGPFDIFKQNKLMTTPKTPCDGDHGSESRLESLPMDLLVKIMCHLHHDQLRAVFHVSRKIRKAVIQARQFHFNFTTPDRARQEMLSIMTPRPTDHWPFLRVPCSKGDDKCLRLLSPIPLEHQSMVPAHLLVSSLQRFDRLQPFYLRSQHFHPGVWCPLYYKNLYASHWLPIGYCSMRMNYVRLLPRINCVDVHATHGFS